MLVRQHYVFLQRVIGRRFHLYRNKMLHSDDDDDDVHHIPKPQLKKGDFTSKLPPIMPPNDFRMYQPKEIPEPNEDNIIRAKDNEEQVLTNEQRIRLNYYADSLREIMTLEKSYQSTRAEMILEEMQQEGLWPDANITYLLNVMNLQREETKEEKIHRTRKPTDKKQTDPDFFEPLREKPPHIKTKRHSESTIDHIFKTRGMTKENFKKHLQEEEKKRQEASET